MKSSVWFGKIAGYKSQLFSNLKGKAHKVLEIGIGTGPNLKYYAGDADVQVFGVDPNGKMEKYARAAAVAAGLPLAKFEFIQAVRMLPWRYFFLKLFMMVVFSVHGKCTATWLYFCLETINARKAPK